MTPQSPLCKNLVLDAGPLLSLSPLQGLAETYLTVPQVLAELKDKRAREHFEQLGLVSGVKIEVKTPDSASLVHVIQWAKKTGDYAVLSHPDLCVLALTHSLHEQEKRNEEKMKPDSKDYAEYKTAETDLRTITTAEDVSRQLESISIAGVVEASEHDPVSVLHDNMDQESIETPDKELSVQGDTDSAPNTPQNLSLPGLKASSAPIYDDPSDSDDGEGDWITPDNVALHKSRALDLIPEAGGPGKQKAMDELIRVGCMTADFAMQNVLLQMGLDLVGVEGKRIQRVKTWVLRCHACYKICKDASKKFCPSCGNATLLRASVTISAPNAASDAPVMQVHLKANFQHKIRGTKYSIPSPKPGSAKTGPGEGLILREDQAEYMRAKKRADGKKEREEAKLLKGILGRGVEGNVGVGSWMDPDWVPEIIAVGTGGKGRTVRSAGMDGDMPQIGYGKKNPNERRRRK